MKFKTNHSKFLVFCLALILCLLSATSCGRETIQFEYDDLSRNLDRIEVVNITTEYDPEYKTSIEVIKTLGEDMHETVLREIASLKFHVLFGNPQPLQGKGIIIYDDTYKTIITSTNICKVYLEKDTTRLLQGEFWHLISIEGDFDKLLSEIS